MAEDTELPHGFVAATLSQASKASHASNACVGSNAGASDASNVIVIDD